MAITTTTHQTFDHRPELPGMTKLDTLVLALSCDATKDRREACKESWLSHGVPKGIDVKFVIGRPGQASSVAGYEMFVDAPDTYVGLPMKVWTMIREALMRYDFKWLFKCDDDTWVNLHRLAHYPKSNDYMGRKAALCGDDPDWHKTEVGPREKVGNVLTYEALEALPKSPYLGPWANGGSGYFLSNYACRLIAKEPVAHVQRELYEDKMIGDIMISHGLYLHGAHSTLRHKIDPNSNAHLMGATTLHPLDAQAMRRVYWRLLRFGEIET